MAGCINVTGRIMAWPNLMVDLPATVGALAPLVRGELGRGTHDVLTCREVPRGIA